MVDGLDGWMDGCVGCRNIPMQSSCNSYFKHRGKNVVNEDGIEAACYSGGCAFGPFHRFGVLVFGLMGSFGWMGLLAHTRRPLPLRTDSHRSVCGHAARFRSAQWPAAARTCTLRPCCPWPAEGSLCAYRAVS